MTKTSKNNKKKNKKKQMNRKTEKHRKNHVKSRGKTENHRKKNKKNVEKVTTARNFPCEGGAGVVTFGYLLAFIHHWLLLGIITTGIVYFLYIIHNKFLSYNVVTP